MSNRLIAALCVERQSVYKRLKDVECYDYDRGAKTFTGGCPIIAHPPCRAWSAFCAHQAKPEPGEKELGLWCARMLRECGGVLEQPAHSRLFQAAGLPGPGETDDQGIWTAEVWQAWFGFNTKKTTWLCISGTKSLPDIPYRLHDPRGDGRRMAVMSKNQRSRTTPEFAWFLVQLARSTRRSGSQDAQQLNTALNDVMRGVR